MSLKSTGAFSRHHDHILTQNSTLYALKTALFKTYVFKVMNGNIAFTTILYKVGLLLLSCEPCNCVIYIVYMLEDFLFTHQMRIKVWSIRVLLLLQTHKSTILFQSNLPSLAKAGITAHRICSNFDQLCFQSLWCTSMLVLLVVPFVGWSSLNLQF